MTAYISGGPMSLLRGFSVRQAPILRQSVRIGLVAGMSLLSGCVSYSPMEIDPFEEIRKLEQRSDRPLEVQASAPGGPAWLPIKTTIDLSDGLELSEANALALSFSPGIRATRNEMKVAGAQLIQAGLLTNPELFLGPRISSGGGDLILPAGLSWELPLWGQGEAEKSLARSRLTLSLIHI